MRMPDGRWHPKAIAGPGAKVGHVLTWAGIMPKWAAPAAGGDSEHNGTGTNSTAVGTSATATADRATSVGDSAAATGARSVAVGAESVADSADTVSVGVGATTGGSIDSVAVGRNADGSGGQATALGRSTTATAGATAVGYNSVANTSAVALGAGAIAAANKGLVTADVWEVQPVSAVTGTYLILRDDSTGARWKIGIDSSGAITTAIA